jgi:hypothetical protein
MKKPYLTPTIEFVYLGLPKKALLSDDTDNGLPDKIDLIQGSPVP